MKSRRANQNIKSKPPQPRKRKAIGYFIRFYVGGIFDGIKESVPVFRGARSPLKPYINKEGWIGAVVRESNIYSLSEPRQKPKNGATYIYQFQP